LSIMRTNFTFIFVLTLLLVVYSKALKFPSERSNCQIDPDNHNHWPEWPPIVTNEVGDLILPVGDDGNRALEIAVGEVVLVSCGADGRFDHEASWAEGPLYARCSGGTNFQVWTEQNTDEAELSFRDLGCSGQPLDSNEPLGNCGPNNEGIEVVIGFDTVPADSGIETAVLTVCYDVEKSINIWSRHTLWDEIRARDHNNDSPFFNPDDYFDFDVNHYYTMATQKETIAQIVRSQDLADEYVQDFDSGLFLARGHLAPNADFVFYSWMDATYHFINVAPQWQSFNGGNWMWFENGCRDFADERGVDLVVYTGTHGVCELEDVDGEMVDIFLYDGDKLPVPRYYWKILYDPIANTGVAVVGVNNPHLKAIPPNYIICPSVESHPILDNIHQPENIVRGFIWACKVEDLAASVPNVPNLPEMELLM